MNENFYFVEISSSSFFVFWTLLAFEIIFYKQFLAKNLCTTSISMLQYLYNRCTWYAHTWFRTVWIPFVILNHNRSTWRSSYSCWPCRFFVVLSISVCLPGLATFVSPSGSSAGIDLPFFPDPYRPLRNQQLNIRIVVYQQINHKNIQIFTEQNRVDENSEFQWNLIIRSAPIA